MDRELTFLERGVFVTITKEEFMRLHFSKAYVREKSIEWNLPLGFLKRENYPPTYEKIAKDNEVGRFQFFRFLLKEGE